MARDQLIQVRKGSGGNLATLTADAASQKEGELIFVTTTGNGNTAGKGLYLGTGSTQKSAEGTLPDLFAEPIPIDIRFHPTALVDIGSTYMLVVNPITGQNLKVAVSDLASILNVTGADTKKVKVDGTDAEGYLIEKLGIKSEDSNILALNYNSGTGKLEFDFIYSSVFASSANGLTLAADGINATHLAHNIDATDIGFDADKVDGKHVDDTGNTVASLWTAAKIIEYVRSEITGKTTIFAKYAMDSEVLGSVVSKKLQIGGSPVEFPTGVNSGAVALDDRLITHTLASSGPYSVPYNPVVWKCTGAAGTSSPDWEVDTSITINEATRFFVDNTVNAVTGFSGINFLWFIDTVNETGPIYGLYTIDFGYETPGVSNGMSYNSGSNTYSLVPNTAKGITVTSSGIETKYDNSSIGVNGSGNLYVIAVSGGEI